MRCLVAAIVFVIAGLSFASGRSVDGQADFAASLQQVGRLMDAHKSKEAKALLQAKLGEHAEQGYVRDSLAKVRESLKRCSFEIAFPRRGIEEVLCGEVVTYDAKTGSIELRYKRRQPSQSTGSKDAPKKDASFECGDFERIEKERVLKLPFAGPHFIELDGKAMDQMDPTVRVGIGNDATYLVTYAFGSGSKIETCEGADCKTLAFSTTSSNVLRPYKIKVSVREKQIDALHNGKRIVLADCNTNPYGRFGFAQFANLEEIRVSGVPDKTWIEARVEERANADFAEFEKSYDAQADLPEWLRTH